MLKVNVNSWKMQIESNARQVIAASDKAFQKSAVLLRQKIIDYTPVGDVSLWNYPPHKDYTPGYLKSNWKMKADGKDIAIYNDAPYALRVENGWSSQAPNGMMRRAWMDYPILLEQAAREFKL